MRQAVRAWLRDCEAMFYFAMDEARIGRRGEADQYPVSTRAGTRNPSSDTEISILTGAWRAGLAWIENHLSFFVPEKLTNPDQFKAITELSLFYGEVRQWVPAAERDKLAPIGNFVHAFLSKDAHLSDWVRSVPCHYNPYILAYLPLRSSGLRISQFEEAIRVLDRAGYPEALETIPYRQLELRYLAWRAGLRRRAPSWGATYRATVICRSRNPIYLSLYDVYSVTHTLIYLSGFGGPVRVPEGERRRLYPAVEALLVHFWRKPDWDVAGELMINLIALDRGDTAVFRAAFAAVLQAWRSDGALPGPHFREAKATDREHLFQNCYHTTLVGLMLCALWFCRLGGGSERFAEG